MANVWTLARRGQLPVPVAVLPLLAAALLLELGGREAATRAPIPQVVTIHGSDFAFTAPSSIPAGVTTFTFVNDGPGLHQAQIVRLDSGKTMAELTTALSRPGPLPTWAVEVGGPNAVDSGRVANATLDMRPGNYALLCEVNFPDGVAHFRKGMLRPLTVTTVASAAHTSPPAPDVTVTLHDYAFTLSGPVTTHTRTFAVHNAGTQPHMLELIRLAPGKSVADLMAWLQHPQGPPPRQALGGVATVAPTSPLVSFTAELTPGHYALLCFALDAGGKPHIMRGMVLPLSIP